MAIKRIDSYLDTVALKKEHDEFVTILEKDYDHLVKLYEVIQKSKGSSTMSQAVKDSKDLDEAIKQTIKTTNDLEKQKQRLIQLQTEEAKKIAEVKLQIQEQTKANKENAKESLGMLDAYQQLEKQFKEAAKAAKDLSARAIIDPTLAKSAEEAALKAKDLNDQLKAIDASIGNRQRNVGNYEGSAKIIVDALQKEISKLDELKKKRDEVTAVGGSGNPFEGTTSMGGSFSASATSSTSADLEAINKQIADTQSKVDSLSAVTENPKFLNIAGKVGDATVELKFFTKALIEMERNGLGSSEAANELRATLAELKDGIGDAKAEIDALSSDTRSFDLFAGAVTFAADSFQLFAGAAQLAGASEEDAAAATATLVAVQSVANGVKGIANELTTRGTAANIVYAAVQQTVATATDASASATVRLAAATKLLLGGALIGVLAFAIVKFIEYRNAIKDAGREAQLLSEINSEVAKSAGGEIATLERLYYAATNTTVSIKERKKAVDALQDQYPEHFKNIKDEVILQGQASAAYDKVKLAILETAKVRAVENKLSALATEELEINLSRESKLQDKAAAERQVRLNKQKADAAKASGNGGAGPSVEDILAGSVAANAINEALDQSNKDLQRIAKDRAIVMGQITTSGVETKTDEKKKASKSGDDLLSDQIDAEKRRNEALRALAIEQANERIRIAQLTIDDENALLEDQLKAVAEIGKQRNIIAGIEYAGQVEQDEKVQNGKRVAIKKTNEELLLASTSLTNKESAIKDEGLQKQIELETDYAERLKKLREESVQANLDLIEKEVQKVAESSEQIDTIFVSRALSISGAYYNEVKALNDALLAGNISAEEYAKQKVEIDKKYAKESTNVQKDELIAQLTLVEGQLSKYADAQAELENARNLQQLAETQAEKDAADDQVKIAEEKYKKFKEYQKQWNEISKQLLDENGKVDEQAVADEIARREQLKEAKTQLATELYNLGTSLINATFENEMAALDETQRSNDKAYQKEVENITNSTLSEEEKANRLAILEKEKETKDAELERKKKDVQIKQAKFEKAKTIAEIGFATALAVIKAVAASPLTGGLPFSAIAAAIGAVQIAAVLARPIPQYADGLENNPVAHFGIHGEAGPELITKPGQQPFISNRPTLDFLPVGTNIRPLRTDELNQAMNSGLMQSMANGMYWLNHEGKKNTDVVDALNKQTRQLAAAFSRSRPAQKTPKQNTDLNWLTYIHKNIYN